MMENDGSSSSSPALGGGIADRRGKSRRGRGKRQGEGGEDRGERRGKSQPVWADGIERAMCSSAIALLPEAAPVTHRTGMATRAPVVVAWRESALLLCTCDHPGSHLWPDGEDVGRMGWQRMDAASSPQAETDAGGGQAAEERDTEGTGE